MKNFYLAAAVLGAVVPYVFFVDFFAEHGVVLSSFLGGLFANGAAGGFAADIFISSAVFWGYLIANKARWIWAYVVVNLTIGLSCALPAYLYMQARAQEQQRVTD